MPSSSEARIDQAATWSATRPPWRTRLKVSRPSWSVPARWARLGPLEPRPDVDRVRVVGGEPGGEERAREEQRDQDQAGEAERIAEQPAQAGEARAVARRQLERDAQRPARTRGSSQALSRSASSALSTNSTVVTSTAPWTTG